MENSLRKKRKIYDTIKFIRCKVIEVFTDRLRKIRINRQIPEIFPEIHIFNMKINHVFGTGFKRTKTL